MPLLQLVVARRPRGRTQLLVVPNDRDLRPSAFDARGERAAFTPDSDELISIAMHASEGGFKPLALELQTLSGANLSEDQEELQDTASDDVRKGVSPTELLEPANDVVLRSVTLEDQDTNARVHVTRSGAIDFGLASSDDQQSMLARLVPLVARVLGLEPTTLV